MYIHTYTYIHIHTYTYQYSNDMWHIHIHTSKHTYTYVNIYTYLYLGDKWHKADGNSDFQIRLPAAAGALGGGARHSLSPADYTDMGKLSMKYQPIFEFEGRGGLALMERFQARRMSEFSVFSTALSYVCIPTPYIRSEGRGGLALMERFRVFRYVGCLNFL